MLVNLGMRARQFYDTHTKGVLIGVTSVAVLGCAYYIGKTHGELNVEVYLRPSGASEYVPLSTFKATQK